MKILQVGLVVNIFFGFIELDILKNYYKLALNLLSCILFKHFDKKMNFLVIWKLKNNFC